jgi:hypothetical protein
MCERVARNVRGLIAYRSLMRKRAAWVIIWRWFGATRKPYRLIIHILPPRWATSRIVDCMKALYLNSEFFAVSERFDYFPLKAWNGLVRLEERRILVGHDPHLFASRASDLRTERDQSTGAQMG